MTCLWSSQHDEPDPTFPSTVSAAKLHIPAVNWYEPRPRLASQSLDNSSLLSSVFICFTLTVERGSFGCWWWEIMCRQLNMFCLAEQNGRDQNADQKFARSLLLGRPANPATDQQCCTWLARRKGLRYHNLVGKHLPTSLDPFSSLSTTSIFDLARGEICAVHCVFFSWRRRKGLSVHIC